MARSARQEVVTVQSSPEPTPLTRRERRKREVRDRILEAAVVLFEQHGFGATTVAEICERADVAHKTFFNHFPSKRDLLRETFSAFLGQLVADIDEARREPGTTRERLSFFFERMADSADDAGKMHRELVTELIHAAHEGAGGAEEARKISAAFGGFIRDGLARGELTLAHDADTLTEMLMGAYYVLMLNWAHLEDYPLRERALSAARFLGDALCAPANGGRG